MLLSMCVRHLRVLEDVKCHHKIQFQSNSVFQAFSLNKKMKLTTAKLTFIQN